MRFLISIFILSLLQSATALAQYYGGEESTYFPKHSEYACRSPEGYLAMIGCASYSYQGGFASLSLNSRNLGNLPLVKKEENGNCTYALGNSTARFIYATRKVIVDNVPDELFPIEFKCEHFIGGH